MNEQQLFPRAVVTGLIIDAENRLLLLKSEEWGGRYVIPGGKIRYGERIVDALKREIKEETNLTVDEIEFLFIAESIMSAERREKNHAIYLIHRCKRAGGEVRLNHESQSFTWASVQEALSLPINSTSRSTLEKLIELQIY